jgi:hypothetical protein
VIPQQQSELYNGPLTQHTFNINQLDHLDNSSFVTFSSNSSSHTRSSSDNLLHVNQCRTYLFRNSFFNRIVFLWNNLSPTIRNSSSVSSFKNRLTACLYGSRAGPLSETAR